MEPKEAGTDLWYGKSRRSGTRTLDETERRKILTERIILRIVAVLSGIGTPILFLFALAGLTVLTEKNNYNPSGRTSEMLITIGGLVFLALLVIITNQSGRRSTGLRKDLLAGFVNQYLVQGQTIEILPHSNRVWKVDGVIKPWYIGPAEQEELAVPMTAPEIRVSDVLDIGYTPTPPIATVRSLSDAERDELRRLARKRWLSGLPWTILISLWFWPLLIYGLNTGKLGEVDPRFFGLGVLAVVMLPLQIFSFFESHQLWQDWADGRLFPLLVKGRLEERLAISRRPWTVDGQPASWRRKPNETATPFEKH